MHRLPAWTDRTDALTVRSARGVAVALVILTLALARVAAAQDTSARSPRGTISGFLEEEDREGSGGVHTPIPGPGVLAIPLVGFGDDVPAEVAARHQQNVEAYYDYNTRALDHRSRVFDWQLFSTRVIFWIVIALVGFGTSFSALQFFMAAWRPRAAGGPAPVIDMNGDSDAEAAADEDASDAAPRHVGGTIRLGKDGVEVSSPVLGVILLTLSLGFFFLYLVYVYPIEDSF